MAKTGVPDTEASSVPSPSPVGTAAIPGGWRPYVGLLTIILIVAATLLLLSASLRREPIIEFEAQTAIVSFAVTGGNEATWNLPAKVATFMTIVGDEPVDKTHRVGIGPLVLPPGTKVTIIRLEGEPLHIRIDAVDEKRLPFLLDANGRLILPAHATIRVETMPGEAAVCRSPLPQTAFRAVGAMEVGANLAEDAFDEADQLASIDEKDFASRFIQPALQSGSVSVFGRTLFTGLPYRAENLTLRRGDLLRFAPPDAEPDQPGTFFVETAGCSPLYVRGVQLTRQGAIQRLGSAPSPIKLSVWQMITGDAIVSVLVAGFAALLGSLRIALDIAEFRRGYFSARSTPKRTRRRPPP